MLFCKVQQTLLSRTYRFNCIAFFGQDRGERIAYSCFIIDDKNGLWHTKLNGGQVPEKGIRSFSRNRSAQEFNLGRPAPKLRSPCWIKSECATVIQFTRLYPSAARDTVATSAAGNSITNRAPVGMLSSARIIP